jgi:hypothetical protein
MSSSHSALVNKVDLQIAGITLSIFSEEIDLTGFINPVWQLFVVRNNEPEQALEIVFSSKTGLDRQQADPHPMIDVFQKGILLRFPKSTLSYDFESKSGVLETPDKKPVLDLEYSLRILFAYFVLWRGGVLIHAAGIARNGSGFVFCGPSGIGKSTVVNYSKGLTILNDDLTVIAPGHENPWEIFATPFANPNQPVLNSYVRLSKIFLLKQSNEVGLGKISRGRALSEFIANVPVLSRDRFRCDRLIYTSEKILQKIPFYKLNFKNDPTFWTVIDD